MRSPGDQGRSPRWRSRRRSARARSSCRGAWRRTRPACGRGLAASCPWDASCPRDARTAPRRSGGSPPDLSPPATGLCCQQRYLAPALTVGDGGRDTRVAAEVRRRIESRAMLTAVANTAYADAAIASSLDDQLIARLLYHRIIVLGTEVND